MCTWSFRDGTRGMITGTRRTEVGPVASPLSNRTHAGAQRRCSEVFITINVRIPNWKWWLHLLQSVLLKDELLVPSSCSLSSAPRAGMINALTVGNSAKKKTTHPLKVWSFCWSVSPALWRFSSTIFTVWSGGIQVSQRGCARQIRLSAFVWVADCC